MILSTVRCCIVIILLAFDHAGSLPANLIITRDLNLFTVVAAVSVVDDSYHVAMFILLDVERDAEMFFSNNDRSQYSE